MKKILFLMMFIVSSTSFAQEAARCYGVAFAHPSNGGLGLVRIHAQELCVGAENAREVIGCYVTAFAHRNNGGLGLPRGFAIELCARTKSARNTMLCWNKMASTGAIVGHAIEMCKAR